MNNYKLYQYVQNLHGINEFQICNELLSGTTNKLNTNNDSGKRNPRRLKTGALTECREMEVKNKVENWKSGRTGRSRKLKDTKIAKLTELEEGKWTAPRKKLKIEHHCRNTTMTPSFSE